MSKSPSNRPHSTIAIAIPNLRNSITMWVIYICASLYLSLAVLNLLNIWGYGAAYSYLGLSWAGISNGFIWQFISSPFVHGDIQHLVFNMLALAFLGGDIEQRLGRKRYIRFSVICALAGMTGYLLLGSASVPCIGYSGVIYGILAASAILYPDRIIRMFWVFPMKMKWAMVILGMMALFMTIQPGQDRIAHSAHLFGALAGYVYIKLSQRPGRQKSNNQPKQCLSSKRNTPKSKQPPIRVPDEL